MKKITAALLGNPNCGKTTLFNVLTGSHAYVGNRPGVTVEKQTGYFVYQNTAITLVDLPGIYSLSPETEDEEVAFRYLTGERPDVLLCVADAEKPERSLFLVLQAFSLGIPTIIALNRAEMLRKKHRQPDIGCLERGLGVPVIPISASRKEGIETLCESLLRPGIPVYSNRTATEIYGFLERLCQRAFTVPKGKKKKTADSVLLHPYLAYPCFFIILGTVFFLAFGSFGSMLTQKTGELLSVKLLGFFETVMEHAGASTIFKSFVSDALFTGLGAAVAFVPQLAILFFLLSFLEDSGYMARAAYLWDKPMRRLGLSGKAFIPLLLGFGCTVPAVMAARTLGEKERKSVTRMVPFFSCSAKLPVYAMVVAAFFKSSKLPIVLSIYTVGIVCALVCAAGKKKQPQTEVPFLLELPEYRFPSVKGLLSHVWRRLSEFFHKIGTVLLAASLLIWLLKSFDKYFCFTQDLQSSLLFMVGKLVSVLFIPCGFGDERVAAALLTGLAAKESIVTTLSMLCNGELTTLFTPVQAYSFLIFVLLYTPCVAALWAIGRERGSKNAAAVAIGQFAAAWCASAGFYQFMRLLSFA